MQQHASSAVPEDAVLIIPEESSGKYLHLVIIFWLSVQSNFTFAVGFIYPRSAVVKLFFFTQLDFNSTSIFNI